MKKYNLFFLMIAVIMSLSACGINQTPITAETEGVWNHLFVYPMSWLIIHAADLLNGSFGLAIIIITIGIRLLLLPFMLKQQKSTLAMQELKPKMDSLQERYKDVKDTEKQQEMQKELIALYKENGVNPLMGCLPMLVQAPILMAFYFAIMRTEQITFSPFLWLNFGQADPFFILPILAGLTTFLQTKLASTSLNDPMKVMMYIMPVFIIFIGSTLPAALSLYWSIGNIFMIVQTYFTVTRAKPRV